MIDNTPLLRNCPVTTTDHDQPSHDSKNREQSSTRSIFLKQDGSRQSDQSGIVWMNRRAVVLRSARRLDESGYFWMNRRGGSVALNRRRPMGRSADQIARDRGDRPAAAQRDREHELRPQQLKRVLPPAARPRGPVRIAISQPPRLSRQGRSRPASDSSSTASSKACREPRPVGETWSSP